MMKDLQLQPKRAASRLFSKLTTLLTAAALTLTPMAAHAQQGDAPRLLRDAEIEQLLRDYTRRSCVPLASKSRTSRSSSSTTPASMPLSLTVAASSSITVR